MARMSPHPATSPAAVLLDFYGTLAEAVSWGPSFEDVFAGHGFAADDPSAYWRTATGEGLDHREHSVSREAYVAWERRRLVEFARGAGVPAGRLDAVVDDLYHAAKTFELRVYPETHEVLEALSGAGVRLAVCSNWDWDLPDILERLGLAHTFDVVVTSARAGARKPHPHIYRHTLSALDALPHEAVFVGDSWEPDVAGPLAFGLRAVHVARNTDATLPEVPDGASRTDDLTGLLALVGAP